MNPPADNIRIRAARPDEAELLSALALRSKAHWGYTPEFVEACRGELTYGEQQLRSEHVHCYVLELDAIVAGFHVVLHESAESVELDALFLEPRFIGRGFGRRLIDHAKSVAAKLGARRLTIHGDPNAEAFYLAVGAVRRGERESRSVPGRFLPVFEVDVSDQSGAPP